jgi:hypothetical protein
MGKLQLPKTLITWKSRLAKVLRKTQQMWGLLTHFIYEFYPSHLLEKGLKND